MVIMQNSHHSANCDLNLLEPLRVLLEERHVTRAAKRCHMSQSAMSRVLEKLREMFGDELLIRTGKSYERTPRGERVMRELGRILPRVDDLIRGCVFEAALSRHRFRISMTDYAAAVVLPALFEEVSTLAPHMTLEVIGRDDRVEAELESGKLDLSVEAAGAIHSMDSSVLFDEEFVCLVAGSHPFGKKRFSLEEYLHQQHIIVNTFAGQQTLVDRPLADLGLRRQVTLTLPYFGSATLCVRQGHHVVTVPKRFLGSVPLLDGLRVVSAPAEIPQFKYAVLWHRRQDQDPAHRWLREQMARICQPQEKPGFELRQPRLGSASPRLEIAGGKEPGNGLHAIS